MPVSRSASSLTLSSLSVLLSYALFISLFSPFAISKAEAAYRLKKKAPSPVPTDVSTQSSAERAKEMMPGAGQSAARMDTGMSPGKDNSQADRFKVTPPAPVPGTPLPNSPNLDEIRSRRQRSPRAPLAIPSTRCSPRLRNCAHTQQAPLPPPVVVGTDRQMLNQLPAPLPTELIAANSSFPAIDSLLGLDTGMVSDSPFTIKLRSPDDDKRLSSSSPVNSPVAASANYRTSPLAFIPQAPPGVETVWVDDQVPAGGIKGGNNETGIDSWSWINAAPSSYSGTQSHQSLKINTQQPHHNHFFVSATATLSVGVGDTMFSYVYIDPNVAPPTELMLQWSDGTNWYNAYWGADHINWVSGIRLYMGAVPAAGQWVRLEVHASQLLMEGKTLSGMAFNAWDGRVAWDRAGKSAPAPVTEQVWVEDSIPAGGIAGGNYENNSPNWSWTNASPSPYSGTLAHRSANSANPSGLHNHYFTSATSTLTIAPGDRLFSYVYVDPISVPSELMLQWTDGVTWYNAYWGADQIVPSGNPAIYMGAVPAAGQWVRLEVPASQLLIEGKTLSGMAFDIYNGSVTWDRAGKTTQSSSSTIEFSTARTDPVNRTGMGGEDLLSGNYNWSVPLVGLTGRAGLDLGLSLSYNSLVWTRSGSYITYDADRGFPSPGFRLGFPTIQSLFYNAQTGKNTYLLITPSGSRVELRQTAPGSSIYESADSSHLQFDSSQMLLRTTDGTRLSYALAGDEYRCTQIKDRNGNFITVNYDALGHITTVVDTLGRTVTFNYDASQNLNSITELRNIPGETQPQARSVATFRYNSNLMIQTNFVNESGSPLTMIGVQNNSVVPVLSMVGLGDGSYYKFTYTSWGQVSRITRYGSDSNPDLDDHPMAYVNYNLPLTNGTPLTDCPRFTERRDWAENWNGGAEAVTTFTIALNNTTGSLTLPTVVYDNRDGTNSSISIRNEEEFGTGWKKGLTLKVRSYANNVLVRTNETLWTQDDETLSYQLNPRPKDIYVSDEQGNNRRINIDYGPYAAYGLPYVVRHYAADGTTVLREVYTDYNLSAAYLNRHIIGLVSARHFKNNQDYLAKVVYTYDEGGAQLVATPAPAIQHDAAYDTSFTARGNVTSVARYDVTDINNSGKAVVTQTGYDVNGMPVFVRDPAGHETSISYTDSFSDNINRNTFAYPSTITDAEGYQATSKYDYYQGVVTFMQDPKGAAVVNVYDGVGRITSTTSSVNGAFRQFVYGSNYTVTWTTRQFPSYPAYGVSLFDGAGRVYATAQESPVPGVSASRFSGQKVVYDVLGRVVEQTNPTEVNGSWVATGDDAIGWVSSFQTYDWKGRVKRKINADGTTTEATYGGCGCAGGETVEVRDEIGRRRKTTSDVLGRQIRAEVFNSNGTVYSTVVTTYNALDQATNIRQYQGSDQSGIYQETLMSYDGHARLSSSKLPQQTSATLYTYYPDDLVQTVQDARGVVAAYTYYARHLVKDITYSVPEGSNIAATAQVSFTYDEAGNRTSMTDGMGTSVYHYDQLSRMDWETRTIKREDNTLLGPFQISYTYNLIGDLTSITDPFNSTISYARDYVGRMTSVSGPEVGGISQYVSEMRYRAWGALKSLSYGNTRTRSTTYNSRMQPTHFEVPGVMSSDYQYYEDGRVSSASDVLDTKFSRSYSYDGIGRLSTSATPGNGPYNESFGYDVWNNLTSRATSHWSQNFSESATYVNNRNPQWLYDADGRVTKQGLQEFTFDAAGQMTRMYNPAQQFTSHFYNITLTYGYDGAGQKLRQTKSSPNFSPTSTSLYYLHSTVLGGKVLAEADGGGQLRHRYVYMGAEELVRDNTWVHENPVTGSQRRTNHSGAVISTASVELDALGNEVGLSDPYPSQAEMDSSDWAYPRRGEPVNQFGGCSVDGVPAPCGYAAGLLNMGSAALCPGGNCGPRRVPARDSHGNITYTWGLLTATATGVGYSYSTYVQVSKVVADPDHPGQIGVEDNINGGGQWQQGRGFAYLGGGRSLEGFLNVIGHHSSRRGHDLTKVKTAVGDCSRRLFGIVQTDFQPSARGQHGSFTGTDLNKPPGNSEVHIVNDVKSFSSSGLAALQRKFGGSHPPGMVIAGLTIDYTYNGGETGFSPHRNYTASDRGRFPTQVVGLSPFIDTQIWELGNSLSYLTNITFGEEPLNEPGKIFQQCVKANLKGGR